MYTIVGEPLTRLAEHAEIPIRFVVSSVFDVEGDDPDSAKLDERPAEPVWIKDYDAIKGEGPTRWAKRWDISNWGLLAANGDGQRIGGCVLAYNTDGVNKLEGRDDVVAVWDIRVHPGWRGRGVGRQLFGAAVARARENGEIELGEMRTRFSSFALLPSLPPRGEHPHRAPRHAAAEADFRRVTHEDEQRSFDRQR